MRKSLHHRFLDEIARGFLAGLAGTAAITAFQMIEMKLTRRPQSTAPVDAAGKALGFQPRSEESKQKLSHAIHWLYGTGWGLVRSMLDAARVPRVAQPIVHFAAIWATAMILPPKLQVAPPPSEWGAKEIALGGVRHAVYAAGADAAFALTAPR